MSSEELTTEQTEPETPRDPVAVQEVAQIYLGVFADLAFQRMGLHADTVTGQVVRDLPQAKLAVDIAAYIGEQLLPSLDESVRREVMNLVSALRLNYTRQVQAPEEASE